MLNSTARFSLSPASRNISILVPLLYDLVSFLASISTLVQAEAMTLYLTIRHCSLGDMKFPLTEKLTEVGFCAETT